MDGHTVITREIKYGGEVNLADLKSQKICKNRSRDVARIVNVTNVLW